jgi:glycosyltransferase involved in cell wall biosynthesis
MSHASRPLRIWHVNVGNHAGMVDGVAVVATQLARDQAERGHDVRLVAGGDHVQQGPMREAVGPHVDLTLVTTLREVLASTGHPLADPGARPDVMHLHSVFRPVHRLLARRARRLGIPVVLSPHCGLAPDLLRRDRLRKLAYGGLVERRFFRSVDGVHALQLVEQEDVQRYCRGQRPVAVIPNPVDPALREADPWEGPAGSAGTNGSRPQAVLLCRYDVYQKGLDRLDALARQLPDVDFRVYGHADKNAPERAEALIAAAPGNLHFESPVYGADKLQVLRRADVFLQPSRVEGLSVALVEALALGVPCAVSAYVGRSLDMDRQGTALVLDDTTSAAAAQLAALLADRSRLVALGQAARAYAARELDPDVVAERHLAHYESLLPGVPTRART